MQPDWITPMEPVSVEKPFDDERYLYQVKWDGIRILSSITPAGVSLRTRRGNVRTAAYPELAGLRDCLQKNSAVLDGEVIVFGEKGIPSFNRVLKRDLAGRATKELQVKYPAVYVVFDLLFINDRILTDTPLLKRQEILAESLRPSANIVICDSYDKGTDLFHIMEQKGMEGIVAKEKEGVYHPGQKHKTWLKVKCKRETDALVGGITLENGRITSLLLGIAQEDELLYAGRALTGLNNKDLYQLGKIAQEYGSAVSPFQQPPRIERRLQTVWLPPLLTARVQFSEWSEHGLLRQPVIKSLSVKKQEIHLG